MKRICFLPIAGPEDPGQMLTMRALAQDGRFEVLHGSAGKLLPGTRTWLKYRPDYLHFDWIGGYFIGRTPLHTIVKLASFLLDLLILSLVRDCVTVWTLHNLSSHEKHCPEWLEQGVQRLMARRARWIRVFSQSSVARAAAVLRVPAEKFRVLPEASFVGYYPNAMGAAEARRHLGLATDVFVLLWLGTVRPYKGVEELLECFARVAPPHWRLVIAGRPHVPAYAEKIRALAAGDARVQLHLQFVQIEDLQVFYNACDAVALPFQEVENSGSLLVAMGFARAIVAPAIGIVPERLCRQPELTYPPGQLESALRNLAQTPPDRLQKIGENNLAEAQKYQWGDFVGLFSGPGDGAVSCT